MKRNLHLNGKNMNLNLAEEKKVKEDEVCLEKDKIVKFLQILLILLWVSTIVFIVMVLLKVNYN